MAEFDTDRVHVLGVRHHGPGSARAVRAALQEIGPDAVLVEGPPEADALAGMVGEAEPPVALLAHAPGSGGGPGRAAFWPFAVFSPEWQALLYAHEHGCRVRFCDLPAAHLLAAGDGPQGASAEAGWRPPDPLGVLAEAAGYDDPERWWDDAVEHRGGGGPFRSPFPAIAEAMAEVRARLAPGPPPLHEARREARMRTVLRSALRAGHRRIAVVCGAWHAPALLAPPPASGDRGLLRGLPRVKASVTWIPWSHGRLAAASGYRAGVRAPGWYHHLFTAPDRPVERWLVEAARRLRAEGAEVSSEHVIEGVRLAEALAALRGRPLPGPAEAAEAVSSVLCEGSAERAALVHRALTVGERLGSAPPSAPAVPLQRDLEAQRRRLRLRAEAEPREIEVDLREEGGRARSVLLHRLRILGVHWGVPVADPVRALGTFRERWRLAWEPDLSVAVVEAGVWGTGVAEAAEARARDLASGADLPALTSLTERCLLAGLDGVLDDVLAALSARAARGGGVEPLMAAVPPLARAARYGDVRRTGSAALRAAAGALLDRIRAGLGPALAGLGEEAAARAAADVEAVHRSAVLLGGDAERSWLEALDRLAPDPALPGMVAGRIHRLLRDAGRLDGGELADRLALAVSPGAPPRRATAWLEGFLADGGLLLAHDPALLALVDEWLAGLDGAAFASVLPLLRRTFGGFAPGERAEIGRRARARGAREGTGRAPDPGVDPARAAAASATAALIIRTAKERE
ncbi:DUF5682 family protein [Nocardiopsis composta]|uniref:Uncharacterized protein n=1 Tax=Nocardiopsis composta TaxID=157465 RepID=A0A7W8QK70_9ACTN|nr:DUF5682 family protein [Nocardiopsis composta]MBB5431519.1 hypothetical protein [Nocardiopsis composta]